MKKVPQGILFLVTAVLFLAGGTGTVLVDVQLILHGNCESSCKSYLRSF